MKEKNSGVTLIALIITIIVLLILAGVTIAMIVGDNGILNQAANAKIQTEQASIIEAIELAYSDYEVEMKTIDLEQGDSSKLASLGNVKMERYATVGVMEPTFWNYLVYIKECMNEDGVINVESLVGTELSTGKGNATDKKDVYILEEIGNQYVLKYYDDSASEELWKISSVSTKTVAVYDVDGESIAFEIEFEDGMTWGEWIESEYNTLGIYNDYYIRYTSSYSIINANIESEDYHYVGLDEEIEENAIYSLIRLPL